VATVCLTATSTLRPLDCSQSFQYRTDHTDQLYRQDLWLSAKTGNQTDKTPTSSTKPLTSIHLHWITSML